jgi:hypothetical protein
VKNYYVCPLGTDKFGVDQLKYSEENLKMLHFIEVTKEKILNSHTTKIAEDDEFEYYVDK